MNDQAVNILSGVLTKTESCCFCRLDIFYDELSHTWVDFKAELSTVHMSSSCEINGIVHFHEPKEENE